MTKSDYEIGYEKGYETAKKECQAKLAQFQKKFEIIQPQISKLVREFQGNCSKGHHLTPPDSNICVVCKKEV